MTDTLPAVTPELLDEIEATYGCPDGCDRSGWDEPTPEFDTDVAVALVARIRELEAENACMRATGWHKATDAQRSDDGVIEAAVTEIERAFAELLKEAEENGNKG